MIINRMIYENNEKDHGFQMEKCLKYYERILGKFYAKVLIRSKDDECPK